MFDTFAAIGLLSIAGVSTLWGIAALLHFASYYFESRTRTQKSN